VAVSEKPGAPRRQLEDMCRPDDAGVQFFNEAQSFADPPEPVVPD